MTYQRRPWEPSPRDLEDGLLDVQDLADAAGGGGAAKLYSSVPPVLSAVANTTAEVELWSFTVLAADVAAGDLLDIVAGWRGMQNTGSAMNVTYRFYVNGVAIATTDPISVPTSAIRYAVNFRARLHLYALDDVRAHGLMIGASTGGSANFRTLAGSHCAVFSEKLTAYDFATDKVVKMTAQMGTASASADVRPVGASLTRTR